MIYSNNFFTPIYCSIEDNLWWGLSFWSDTLILFHCLAQVSALCFWKIKKCVDQCESHSCLLQESCSTNQSMFSVVVSNLLKHSTLEMTIHECGLGLLPEFSGGPWPQLVVEFFSTLLTELIIYSQQVRSWLSSLQSPKTDLNKPGFCI